MGEQDIWHGLAAVAQGVQRATEIHRVPQGDGRRDQGEATGAVLLRLSGAVAQAPEPVEATARASALRDSPLFSSAVACRLSWGVSSQSKV